MLRATSPIPSWIRPEIVPFLPIRWYGLMYLVAFAVTYLLFTWQLKRAADRRRQKDAVLDMFFWAIIGLLVGARAFAVTIYDSTGYYLQHPLQIILPFSVVDGRIRLTGIAGMSYHGGVVGATIAIITLPEGEEARRAGVGGHAGGGHPAGLHLRAAGQLHQRASCTAGSPRCPGAWCSPTRRAFPANQPWVKDFAAVRRACPFPATGLVNLPRHPSQLYEAFFEGLVLWLILWFIVRKRKPYKGFVIACYMMGYGVIRFFIEYARQPDKGIGSGGYGYPIILRRWTTTIAQFSWFNFTTGQILNVLLIAAAVIMMAVFRARARRARQRLPEAPHPTGRKLRKKLK